MKPERIALESSSTGPGPKVPGQQRLSRWEIQRTTADGCSLVDRSSDLRGTTSLQAVIGVESDNQTSSFASSRKIIYLQMSWQPQVITSNEENKQSDTGR